MRAPGASLDAARSLRGGAVRDVRHEDRPGRPVPAGVPMNDDMTFRPQSPVGLRDRLNALRDAGNRLAKLSLPDVLEPLGALRLSWQSGSVRRREAAALLQSGSPFSTRAVESALEGLVLSLDARILAADVGRELGRANL